METFRLVSVLFFLLAGTHITVAQTHEETIGKQIGFSDAKGKRAISIQNLKGSVTVEAYSGESVEFEIRKMISAPTGERLAKGKQETTIVIEEQANTIVAYISTPNVEWQGNRYGSISFNDEDEYQFSFDIRVRVPENVDADVSSIGEVSIADVKGDIRASGHRGLKLRNIAGKTDASAHHGDMEVSYAGPIPAGSSFNTHHGDIRIVVPGRLDADITFESHHGDFFTDFPDVEVSAQVNKSVSEDRHQKSYKLKGQKAVRIGKGGIDLDFRSHHGNFYLLSKK